MKGGNAYKHCRFFAFWGISQAMGIFINLFRRNSLDVGSKESCAIALPFLVEEAGLSWWTSNDEIPDDAPRIVVGVAFWTRHDMRMMDALAEGPAPFLTTKNVRVEVFSVDDYVKAGDANQRIPGIEDKPIYHSPIVGIWRNGELAEKAEGYAGRELIYGFLHTITGRDMHPVSPQPYN